MKSEALQERDGEEVAAQMLAVVRPAGEPVEQGTQTELTRMNVRCARMVSQE